MNIEQQMNNITMIHFVLTIKTQQLHYYTSGSNTVSCFIIIQICSSMAIDDRFISLIEINESNEQEHDDNSDEIYVAQRAANFIFPPTSFLSQSNLISDFTPAKRQSFGRKHHWDAFFG
ncbi:unnamed protein product [Adineta steineri]|uniref:Uncharacterized protein n=2 Tax=Adineta steineri TaxID=433720 RepID=A0A819ASI9_9BILA|nr:unnamed protein product [Adineta steineri]CAF3786850.1 unnamed protein product [Adineta steineri]